MHSKHTLAQIFNYQSYPVKIFPHLATQQTLVKHLATQQTLGSFMLHQQANLARKPKSSSLAFCKNANTPFI
jgi:hypothetical protein